MIRVKRYEEKYRNVWDEFVKNSKNSTFLFNREFMEYHKNKFKDHSLLVFKNDELLAILPANEEGLIIYSHAGLTYGGLLLKKDAKLLDVLSCFYYMTEYYYRLGFHTLRYKVMPHYYHAVPSFEDQYAIYLLGGRLVRVDTGFITKIASDYIIQERRLREIKKAQKNNIQITKVDKFNDFWNKILIPNLMEKFKTSPVHTVEEITLLKNKFPANIYQYNSYFKGAILAGVTIFLNNNVVKSQYISVNDKGRDLGALDLLFYHLIKFEFINLEWFDFGTANGNSGNSLNVGLAQWKEGFGSKVFPNYIYEIDMDKFENLRRYS